MILLIGKNLILPKNSVFYRQGFTTIELLIVVLIMVVITGLSMPSFSSAFKKFQLESSVGDFYYYLQYAQSKAITSGRSLELEFDGERRSYWFNQDSDRDISFGETKFVEMGGILGKKRSFPEIVVLQGPTKKFHFHPDGTIDKDEIVFCPGERNRSFVLSEKCLTVSTKVRRGRIDLIKGTDNE